MSEVTYDMRTQSNWDIISLTRWFEGHNLAVEFGIQEQWLEASWEIMGSTHEEEALGSQRQENNVGDYEMLVVRWIVGIGNGSV